MNLVTEDLHVELIKLTFGRGRIIVTDGISVPWFF